MNKETVRPLIAIMIGVISVATSAIMVKLIEADSGIIAFYRMLFSVLLMAPAFLIRNLHELKTIQKRDWLFSIIAGVFLAFHFILWFDSLRYTSVASSTVLVTLQPLFAIAGTFIFFKEPIYLKTVIAGLIAIIGSVLISWGDFKVGGLAFYGDLLALIACALVTGYMLFGQEVRKRVSLTTYTILVYTTSAVTLLFYNLIRGESFGHYSAMTWFWFLMLAIVPNLLGHNLFNWALKWVSANAISIAILFEPVGASILAYFVFKESLTATQVLGGIIVILGITLFVIDISKVKKIISKKLLITEKK
ncbi:DMT family transporter [Rummeliibacillus sp. G93]|uniref:DMT family transporter n=1 Tax=Rummeliibacillus TaxID=648802 RepID=UPI001167F983|nr:MULTISPECIES: DMT family transporter [Rummeliibacillus]MBB5170903.1 drug/metabolite transporter (DMT)-like permease [Rummeliibacillus stabekisii]UQW96580.1 DMT family transporter [Rummeliibacillus sp. G93]GEL05442.1 membrane protein [Rummeliibacillus stabekisii]